MPLTDAKIRTAKIPFGQKQTKLPDGHGLYLLVRSSGKYWKLDYKLQGKRKSLHIGSYPAIRLAGHKLKDGTYVKGARDHAVSAKGLIRQGVDPSKQKQIDRQTKLKNEDSVRLKEESTMNTFETVALDWFTKKKKGLEDSYSKKILSRLNTYLFPFIGKTPLVALTRKQLVETIELITTTGKIETARRCHQYAKAILEDACNRGLLEVVPLGKMTFEAVTPKPMPAVTEPVRVGQVLNAIDHYRGTYVVCCALKILPYFPARPGEFRKAHWEEFDLEKAMWTVPAVNRKIHQKKKRDPKNIHLVPLSHQVVTILSALKRLTGHGTHVFPSSRGDSRPMSENTINLALGAMGFKGEVVGHGFRSTFSTILNMKGYSPDAIERQLAHGDPNRIRAAYNRSDYMGERVQMMQDYADYLDGLRKGVEEGSPSITV